MSENNKKEQNDAIDMTQIINSCFVPFLIYIFNMPVQYQLINCMPYSLSDNAFLFFFKSSSVTIRKLLFGATPPSSSNLPFSILS